MCLSAAANVTKVVLVCDYKDQNCFGSACMSCALVRYRSDETDVAVASFEVKSDMRR